MAEDTFGKPIFLTSTNPTSLTSGSVLASESVSKRPLSRLYLTLAMSYTRFYVPSFLSCYHVVVMSYIRTLVLSYSRP
jgi:hypothetical protein